jgi:hypothetical protein
VRPLSVVLLAPGIDRDLRVLNAGERAVHVEQFLLQRLVQSLDLPRRGRGPGLGQPLGDAILPADPLEQHTSAGRGLPNRPVNCLPLSLSTSPGIPYSAIAVTNAEHTARAVARATTVAMTQNREWSSIPVAILHSRPAVIYARGRSEVSSGSGPRG